MSVQEGTHKGHPYGRREPSGEMRGRLDAWMAGTADPLLEGPIPPGETGVLSRPEDVSPGDLWQYTERREGLG